MTATFASDPEAAMAGYRASGIHIEPDVWTPAECAALIEASHHLPNYQNGSFVPMMMPHRLDPRFLTAMRNPKIVRILERLVSDMVSGLQTEFFYCRPGTPGFNLHQDNFYVQAGAEVFASAWSALEDVSPENGGLIAWPGTHREPLLEVETVEQPPEGHGQDPNANRVRTVLPPGYMAVHLYVPKGAVVFIHGNVVHASNRNRTTDRWRHVLLCTYLRRGEQFRPGNYAQRTEIDLYD